MWSQNNEEEIIVGYFERKPPEIKNLLDIGAYTGVELSNCRKLIVDCKWTGVLVEPSARPFVTLAQNYVKESRAEQVLLVNAFIGVTTGMTNFWHTADAVSTNDPQVFNAWSPQVNDYLPCVIPQIGVADFFTALPGPYSFISIDCEGETWNIFSHLPDAIWNQAQCICVEHAAGGVTFEPQMRDLFARHGFTIIGANGENLIGAR